MFKLPKFVYWLITFLIIIIALLISFLAGALWNSNQTQATKKVTSQIILDRITNQAFLLTKTVYLEQKAQIKIDQGSDWSNFWWGQIIDTNALMKVNVGVDLNDLSVANIFVDNINNKILINLPAAQILDATPEGDISVTTQNGVLKFLLANDPNDDYNQAFKQLKLDATSAVNKNPEILASAQTETITILGNLLKDTGYSVEVKTLF